VKLTLFYRLPVIAYGILIFWQSSFPPVYSEPFFPHDDKVLHFICYAVLGILVFRLLDAEFTWSPVRTGIIAVLLTFAYGISDEIHQLFVPERFASIGDALANLAGAMAGVVFYMIVFKGKQGQVPTES
jgi:VanZ family protein